MSIFRWDRGDNKDKSDGIIELPVENSAEDEMTDINKAAYDSSSQSLDNKMEEIYSTKDKQVKFRRHQPLEEEAAARRKEVTKDELIRGMGALSVKVERVETDVSEIKGDVKSLAEKPAKRWDSLINTIIGIVVGALLALAFSHIGIT